MRSRRALLLGALGGIVGAGLGVLGRPQPVAADSGDVLLAGRVNSGGTAGTTLFASAVSPTLAAFNFGAGDALSAVAVDDDQDALSAVSRASRSGLGAAVRADGGLNPGLRASSDGDGQPAVVGRHEGTDGVGVLGEALASSGEGIGVQGRSSADAGTGVHGAASRGTGRSQGVLGESASSSGIGVLGRSTARRMRGDRAIGVRGESASFVGVWGDSTAGDGLGVVGHVRGTGPSDPSGVYGDVQARSGAAVEGWSRGVTGVGYGVYGTSASASGVGVRATNAAANGSTFGLYADVASPNGLAIFALGGARVTGDVVAHGMASVAAGRFRIDHPSPSGRRQTLSHGFVASDQWKTFYDGTAVLDRSGEAIVTLPSWWARLNRDPRVQLTPVGRPAGLYLAERMSENRFRIAGGEPGQEVHWQVTGVRRDPWALAHPLRVEETKRGKEAERLLHPEERGASPARGVTEGYRLPRRRGRVR